MIYAMVAGLVCVVAYAWYITSRFFKTDDSLYSTTQRLNKCEQNLKMAMGLIDSRKSEKQAYESRIQAYREQVAELKAIINSRPGVSSND